MKSKALISLALIFALAATAFILRTRPVSPAPEDLMALASGEFATIHFHAPQQDLPELIVRGSDGHVRDLADSRGKYLLINFWATWCGPCRAEMPALDALQDHFGRDQLEVIAVSLDREGYEIILPYVRELGLNSLTLAWDSSLAQAGRFGIEGLPGSILVGPDGKWLATKTGPLEWSSPESVAFFEAAVGG